MCSKYELRWLLNKIKIIIILPKLDTLSEIKVLSVGSTFLVRPSWVNYSTFNILIEEKCENCNADFTTMSIYVYFCMVFVIWIYVENEKLNGNTYPILSRI